MTRFDAATAPTPVLVTGGAGYIGSHTCKALAECGFNPIVFDNFSAGHRAAVRWGPLVEGDIRDGRQLREAIETYRVKAVIHFAGLIEVGRSMVRPDLFYDINVAGLACLLDAARNCGVQRIVFSSSAAVYGQIEGLHTQAVLAESDPKEPISPYGDSKLAGERMIAAYCRAFEMTGVALRYFNAAGADPSGVIGEAHAPETHLIPLTIAAGLGRGRPLTVFGADFDTPDGSCLRDYIHVNDLAAAHVAALRMPAEPGEFAAMNVGTGQGQSVLEVIAAVQAELGQPVPHAVGPRRAGDPARLVADPSIAFRRLSWRPSASSLESIVRTAVAWERSPAFNRRLEPAA